MATIALHSSFRRRLAAAGATVVAAATLGAGLGAAPAEAKPKDACATARAIFRANMNEARFWIGAADRLAAAGNHTAANQANNQANYYLGLADGALATMSAAC